MVAVSNITMMAQVPASIEYSKQARERDKYVSTAPPNETLLITRLPESHLMLSYYANDEIWIKQIYLPYFKKKNKFLIVDSKGKDKYKH